MLTMLRKFRQKFLGEGRLSRYLLYALGEIILVVVGILVAIQFNSVQQEKSRAVETRALLNQVLVDLESDSSRFRILYDDYSDKSDAIQQLVLFSQSELALPNDSLGVLFQSVLGFRRYFPSASTFESMVATNHIQYIEDDELVDRLIAYYEEVYLPKSTEFYSDIIQGMDFSQSDHYKAIDRVLPERFYASLPKYRLSRSGFKSDYSQLLTESWAQHFLMECLNQAVFVFNNLETESRKNMELSTAIRVYLNEHS